MISVLLFVTLLVLLVIFVPHGGLIAIILGIGAAILSALWLFSGVLILWALSGRYGKDQ